MTLTRDHRDRMLTRDPSLYSTGKNETFFVRQTVETYKPDS